ncbi:hypothetical protein ACFQ36_03275 [Arthrobacter sp. GCM10027362]|uniref:hypothetical protein n=1 Tax=Arthrobacter sp. GCM10027362 TaxID=3273379 RepID=UPI00362DA10A
MPPRNTDEQPLSGFGALVPAGQAGLGEYLHCREPMRRHDPAERSIYDPVETDETDPLPAVRLETWILRCRCGFQLEVPH